MPKSRVSVLFTLADPEIPSRSPLLINVFNRGSYEPPSRGGGGVTQMTGALALWETPDLQTSDKFEGNTLDVKQYILVIY